MGRDELLRRLALAERHLGWSPTRVRSFLDGHDAPAPDAGRLHLHRQDDGYLQADLPAALLDSLAYREGRAARVAAGRAARDLGDDRDALVGEARGWTDNAEEPTDPEEVDWEFSAAGPTDAFLTVMSREDWVAWFEGEDRDSVEDGRPGYGDLLVQDIEQAVVFLDHGDGRIEILDGWHRIGASVTRGSASVPTLAGRPRAPSPAP